MLLKDLIERLTTPSLRNAVKMFGRKERDKLPEGGRFTERNPEVGFAQRAGTMLNRFVFCCLLVLIVLPAIPYGTVDPWWEAIFECAVFALVAIWIIEGLLRGSWQIKKLSFLLPVMILTAYAFLQTVQMPAWLFKRAGSPFSESSLTIDRYQTYLTALRMLALTTFTGLLILHVSNRRRLQWTVRTVIGVGLGSALFGILRQMLQSSDATNGFVLTLLYPGIGYGQFISSNLFSFLVEMTIGLMAGLVVGAGLRSQQILIYLAMGLIIWAGLVLSNSRGALVGFVCQTIFLLFVGLARLSSRRLDGAIGARRKVPTFIHASVMIRVVVILVIVATLILGVFWMGGDRLATKMNTLSSANVASDGATRREIWKSTWQVIRYNPWTGVGFGTYFLAIPQYQVGSGRLKVEQAHNDYLDLAANGGIVAVVLAAWFGANIIRRARSALRSTDTYRQAAALGAITGILGVAVHSLVDFGLQITGIAVVFVTLIVIAVAEIPSRAKR